MKNRSDSRQIWQIAFLSCIAAGLVMAAAYLIKGYAPFGDNSLATMDANIDYIDFFAYLKDVLSGKNSAVYSFSKGLGGNMIGVVTTGYFSPLNLLVVFFQKHQLEAFFDIVVALKVGLAASAMSIFLQKRFEGRIYKEIVLLLAVSYGLGQYSIAQASNIFFLEGMYMLPLFMLGAWYIVRWHSPFLLIFSVAYNIIFGWYNGAINCIFTVIWVIFELFFQDKFRKQSWKEVLRVFWISAVAAVTGVLMSGAVFLPTIRALGKSSEGTLNFELFRDSHVFLGNMLSVITNYHLGSVSSASAVSLFCGSLTLAAVFGFFICSGYSARLKKIVAALLIFVVLTYYWKPLYLVFSLFKIVRSYWSRYGYLGIFVLIFVAGLFFAGEKDNPAEHHRLKWLSGAAAIYALLIMITKMDAGELVLTRIHESVFCFAIILWLMVHYIENRRKKSGRYIRTGVLLAVFCLAELSYNTHFLMNAYHLGGIYNTYIKYVNDGEKQIAAVKDGDDGTYRITQTATRNMQKGHLTANYDEPALFGYWGVSTYTSCPDDRIRDFLDRAGYRIYGEDLNIVNTSILPVDSLLGVKYILADCVINGCNKIEEIDAYNGKDVYQNPYSFPMIFTYETKQDGRLLDASEDEVDDNESWNPFLYQNELYSQLTGEKTEIFKPVSYEKEEISEGEVLYHLHLPDGRYALYGNLPWKREAGEEIYADGELITYYASRIAPSVFYIPASGNEVLLEVTGEGSLSILEEQFYAADLDLLGKVSSESQSKAVSGAVIGNGFVSTDYTAESDQELLFTSVPYDEDWEILVNGDRTEPVLFGNCLISVPLQKGDNSIRMRYRPSGVREGILTSCFGLLLLTVLIIIRLRKKAVLKNHGGKK